MIVCLAPLVPELDVLGRDAIDLAAIYGVIAFNRRLAVDDYLAAQGETSAVGRAEAEARFDPTGLRERLLARRVPRRVSA